MFSRLFSRISRLPWFLQIFALPAAGVAYVLVQIGKVLIDLIAWVLKEMFGAAKSKAKSTFAPLLWPIAGIALFFFLYSTLDPNVFGVLVQNLVMLAVVVIVLRMMVGSLFPKKRK